jgi:hypothetical protein
VLTLSDEEMSAVELQGREQNCGGLMYRIGRERQRRFLNYPLS